MCTGMSASACIEMNGHANSQHPPRLKQKKPYSTVTTLAFSCVALFVLIIFLAGHNSIIRMHGAMQSPTLERPAGWATLHRTTTVQSATVTITGSAITGSALTATTTETSTTSAASGSGNDQHEAIAAAPAPAGLKASLAHMLGDLQHNLHTLLEAHAGWRPGMKITRAQLAAAAAASMPTEGRDIELNAQKVAQVVGGAKMQEQMQRMQQQGLAAVLEPAAAVTSAETYAGLYGQGGGTVVFEPHDDLNKCPEGSAAPHSAQTAVVLLAGSSTAALKRSLDGMLLLYSTASAEVRGAFHLYIGLDSDDPEMLQAAATYALESLGAVKLVHHSSSTGQHHSENKQYDMQQRLRQSGAPAPSTVKSGDATTAAAATAAAAAAAAGTKPVTSTEHNAGAIATLSSGALVSIGTETTRKLLGTASPDSSSRRGTTTASNTASSALHLMADVPAAPVAAGSVQNHADKSTTAAAGSKQAIAAASSAINPSGHTVPSTSSSSSSSARSDHLRLMLHMFFNCFKYPAVLLLEDDMKLAPDFFEFYAATQWLLGSDKSLYCLSAWNPAGHQQRHVAPSRLLRTDFHPGKGWLLSREVGVQMLAGWPALGVQDWQQYVSSDVVRAGRQCLAPELPRLVPAGEHDPTDYAHIHDPAADSTKQLIPDQTGVLAQAAFLTTADSKAAAQSSSGSASAAVESNQGIMDVEAYTMDYEQASSELLFAENLGQQQQRLDGAVASQQHLQVGETVAAGSSSSDQQADDAAGRQQRQQQHLGWMNQDLSVFMAENYGAYMQQVLLSARPCDVAAAAVLNESRNACRVAYNSAAYLSTIAHKLQIPMVVQQGVHYCYPLPAKQGVAPQQQCQDYMPQMAYHGVVASYNRHGARIYLVHTAYIEALQKASGS